MYEYVCVCVCVFRIEFGIRLEEEEGDIIISSSVIHTKTLLYVSSPLSLSRSLSLFYFCFHHHLCSRLCVLFFF
jgi:hypothetical protein